MEIGYALSSEEHAPLALVHNARRAEQAGFSFALISDHFHPWIDRQGQSAFVWSVLGGIAASTTTLRLGTGVTCPLIRTHPAVVAQAAATTAAMMPGRFFLGVVNDVLATKLLALTEQEPDFRAVLAVARSLREQIDWDAVEARASGSPFARAFFTLVAGLGIKPSTASVAGIA